ncbi:hypothetical protein BDV95DRAFT_31597 [Massariosphaeria phaeospora]|uniref:RING-type domain-containing protein n=1 Tax=Massariosphaeria phaeospora TaxID=100035 RepID=A0A7C8IFW1_9PLEO|nr:hypothetical protein BDV95DRAFT_31597 [Massariosphaeria phaeospora]
MQVAQRRPRVLLADMPQPLQGYNLFNTNQTSFANVSSGEIAYISCDSANYDGMPPEKVLEEAWKKNISAAILYSTTADYCNYTNMQSGLRDGSLTDFALFTTGNKEEAQKVYDNIDDLAISNKYFVTVNRVGARDDIPNAQGSIGGNQNPLGPSPSTAVAMIILYSITGVITALFLVIIVTGAIRAHRHPDRYGAHDVLGRPRQSRARGLGRAILDTIPIVKFGDRELSKPTDVELGSAAAARNADDARAGTEVETSQMANETTPTSQTATPRSLGIEQHSGIAPAEPLAAGVVSTQDSSTSDEALGCSICTEDFEKGQDIRVLPCDHKFHPDCVDPWLLNVSGTCPLCRVDLRPTTSHASADEADPDLLAPPLQPDTEVSHRRRSAFRDILSLRARPNASAEERISALRRLREQRRNGSGDVASGTANESLEDVTANRRSKRMSVRLSEVFGSRPRRTGRDASPQPEESSSGPGPPPRGDDTPNNTENTNPTPRT